MKEYNSAVIFRLLDSIEIKTKIMAHNDPHISQQLRDWQDGKLPDSYFKEFLTRYIEAINE